MENQEQDIPNFEFEKGDYSNDYQLLVQKLRNIKENIDVLEKNFLDKDKKII